MSKRRNHSELVWITPNSGFGAGGRYAVIMPEGQYLCSPDRAITDQTPCMLDCDDTDCMEWADLFTLPGGTRGEAMRNLVAGRYSGAAYHVSECEMRHEAPPDWIEHNRPTGQTSEHGNGHSHMYTTSTAGDT